MLSAMEPASSPSSDSDARAIGRYLLYGQIAAGGMATVHLARQRGAVGFARTVAVKRLRPQFAEDPDFVAMFLDEARLAARIHHPNVVTTLDVVAISGEVFLVMEYVQGESLSRLMRTAKEREQRVDPRFVATILASVLHGLHAAHEAVSEDGVPLNIVHRDVSPQNLLVGVDGVARILDFGVAKAAIRTQTTRDGQLKGKLGYMAPEQLLGMDVTRQVDIYAAAVLLWEGLTMRRAFEHDNEGAMMASVLKGALDPPSAFVQDLAPAFDAVTLRGLHRTPANRYATAHDMALELERCVGIASPSEIGAWVTSLAGPALQERARLVSEIERSSSRGPLVEQASVGEVTQATPASNPRVSGEVLRTKGAEAESGATLKATLDTTPPPRTRRSRLVPAVVGAAVLAGAIGLVVLRSVGPVPSGVAAGGAPATAASPEQGKAPDTNPSAGGSSTAAPTPSAVASTAPTAGAASGAPRVAASEAPDEPATAAKPQTRRLAPTTPKVAPKAAQAPDCNPPYYFDDQGHKHYKDACFH
jgi:eukaryotic-like serine/threonine-protein kinase